MPGLLPIRLAGLRLNRLAAAALANFLGVDVSQLPLAGAAPEWYSEKAVSIGAYVVASGISTVLGVQPPDVALRVVRRRRALLASQVRRGVHDPVTGREEVRARARPAAGRDHRGGVRREVVDVDLVALPAVPLRLEDQPGAVLRPVRLGVLTAEGQLAYLGQVNFALIAQRVDVREEADRLRAHLAEQLIDAEVVIVDNRDAGKRMLDRGEIDALASDQIVLIGQIIESIDPKRYALDNDIFSYEPYALVLRRDDAEFRLVVNRSIAKLYRSGAFADIFYKWIGRIGIDVPPVLAAMYQLNSIPE